jgi:hypothetical protein
MKLARGVVALSIAATVGLGASGGPAAASSGLVLPFSGTIQRLPPTTALAGPQVSTQPLVSADGRFTVFTSADCARGAVNCPPSQLYLWDATARSTTLLTSNASGGPANQSSASEGMSANGRYVVFTSAATDLPVSTGVPDGCVHGPADQHLYRYDVTRRSIMRLPCGQGASISSDGRYVTFASTLDIPAVGDSNHFGDVFLLDTTTLAIRLVSSPVGGGGANDYSATASHSVSSNGRYVVYESRATNITADPGQSSGLSRIYLWDAATGSSRDISTPSSGRTTDQNIEETISDNGRYVAYTSNRPSPVPRLSWGLPRYNVFLYNITTGKTSRISTAYDSIAGSFSIESQISGNGRYVIYSSSAGWNPDGHYSLLRYDRVNKVNQVIVGSVDGAGQVPSTSGYTIRSDGQSVTFSSDMTNLTPEPVDPGSVNIFIWSAA